MDFTPPFGQWLKQQRLKHDLTQADLARRVGYSPITLRKIEAGALKPSKQIVDLLADHLGVPSAQRDAFLAFATSASADKAGPSTSKLPAPATTMIGREKDLAAVKRLLVRGQTASGDLTSPRLVTLVGPPGVGKTRLALAVAREARGAFPDGACWVDIAPITEPEIVLMTIAQVMEIEDPPGKPILRKLQDHLRDKGMLLVLDNLEQVLDAAPLISQVLSAAPRVRVLATSRELLRIVGEQGYEVVPLTDEAVTLFVQRAQAVKSHFALTDTDRATVAAICRKLDGLPLAIELAAARITLFTPAEMLARLDQRLSLLTGGARDLPARQRTLRAALDWSYQFLSPDEQALFRRLGVFVSGFRLHAVKQFARADGLAIDAVDGLATLVARNLVFQVATSDVTSRYAMLETVREFALDQLTREGNVGSWMRKLGEHMIVLSRYAGMNGCSMPEESSNWRAAFMWAVSSPNAVSLALSLFFRGSLVLSDNSERLTMAERLLAHPQTLPDPYDKCWVLFELGSLQRVTAGASPIQAPLEQCLQLCRQHGFRDLIGLVLHELGQHARECGDANSAREYLQESLQWHTELGEHLAAGRAATTLAEVEVLAENTVAARGWLELAASHLSNAGNPPFEVAWIQNHWAHVALLESDTQAASHWTATSMDTFRLSGPYPWMRDYGLAWSYHFLSEIALARGESVDSKSNLAQALRLARSFFDQMSIAWCLVTLAGVTTLDEDPERGALLWGAGEGLRERIGRRIAPASRRNRERTLTTLRDQLGETEFVRLAAEGAKMSVNEAVAFALEEMCA